MTLEQKTAPQVAVVVNDGKNGYVQGSWRTNQ